VQKTGNAPFACGSDYDCSALSVNKVEIILVAGPHAWQAGEVINLFDIIKCCFQQF
jgi:hypothetical protein